MATKSKTGNPSFQVHRRPHMIWGDILSLSWRLSTIIVMCQLRGPRSSNPRQDQTGRRGYFGNSGSVKPRSQRKNCDPLEDSISRMCLQRSHKPPSGRFEANVCGVSVMPGPLFDQIQCRLSGLEELVAFVREIRIIFRHHVNLLPVPFGDSVLRVQLD